MTLPSDRARAMAARIADAAERAGIPEAAVRSITAALDLAMQPRLRHLASDHDPAYLHPGRTVLILLEDVGILDPATLSAAALAETLHPELRADTSNTEDDLAPGTLAILAEVPVPARDRDELLERLVVASLPARLVALAERLDHARHLHLQDPALWPEFHRETCEVYVPVAERTDPTLARRLRWWCRTFANRFLGQPTTAPPGA